MNKILDGLKAAVAVTKCDHALVMEMKQPSDTRYIRQFCPRCEASFLCRKDDPDHLMPITRRTHDQ